LKENRGKSPRRKAKGYIHGTKKKTVHLKKYQEVSQLALDGIGFRAAVNQS
jgi:hypothetical protein